MQGDSASGTHIVTVELGVFDSSPAAPSLINPPDGALNQSLTPTFEWTAGTQSAAFTIEVATDIGFTEIIATATVEATDHTFGSPLDSNQRYFWRVRGANPCGSGPFSPVFDFITEALPGEAFPAASFVAVDADPPGVSYAVLTPNLKGFERDGQWMAVPGQAAADVDHVVTDQ